MYRLLFIRVMLMLLLQKMTKNDILQTAFNFVRESEPEILNTRSISKALRCSMQPVFSCCANMTDLKADILVLVNRYSFAYQRAASEGGVNLEEVF